MSQAADGAAPAAADHATTTGAAAGGELASLVAAGGIAVLSGAGLSTESGIPDYRGPTGQARRAQPMTYQAFTSSAAARQRYWARSHLGWELFRAAQPNAGHAAVAALEDRGLVRAIITQNVDGLHQAAGARDVTELHGSLARVRCLGCGARTSRAELADRLAAANPGFGGRITEVNPDGDVTLADAAAAAFTVADCLRCGGLLKPDVVFFGENVPRPRVERCFEMVGQARALLVLGSSLTVMSGLRFVRHASRLGLPVAIVNQGPTRGDPLAQLRVDAPLGVTLAALARRSAQGG